MKLVLGLVLCGAFLAPGPAAVRGKVYKLYYLGGQSNMDGYGWVKELPDDVKGPVPGVMMFHGNTANDAAAVDGRGLWAEMRPGHGVGFRSDGKANAYSERFGAELTFARRLKELDPEANVAILKYSKGGTSLHGAGTKVLGSWEPDFTGGEGPGKGVNQYDHFLAALRHAAAARDIDGDGQEDTLVPAGIAWMQGESDALHSEEVARQYEANLKRLIDLVRAALRADDLPVVIGRITTSGRHKGNNYEKHLPIVREAQAAFVQKDASAALVTSTDGYAYSDAWHYDTAAYLDMGRQFAQALIGLQRK